jgi:hypothetical protein
MCTAISSWFCSIYEVLFAPERYFSTINASTCWVDVEYLAHYSISKIICPIFQGNGGGIAVLWVCKYINQNCRLRKIFAIHNGFLKFKFLLETNNLKLNTQS